MYRVQKGDSKSWYVSGCIADHKIDFLLDTGAECSIISIETWRELAANSGLVLQSSARGLELADGKALPVLGQFETKLHFGGLQTTGVIMVAPIHNTKGIVGLDILNSLGALLDLGNGQLIGQGHTVVMQRKNAAGICRVVLTEDVVVPSRSELIMLCRVTPVEKGGEEVPRVGALEGAGDLSMETGVVVARAIVNPQQSTTPVRVLNLRDRPVKLVKGDAIALLHPVSEVTDMNVRTKLADSKVAVKLPGYLQSLVDECTDQLSGTERRQLTELVQEFAGSFSAPGKKLGLTHVAEHTIETGETRPIYQANRRLPYATRQAALDERDKMLGEGVIEPSSSPWCSPILLVKKKDGSVRFCVDLRKVNEVTLKDRYPLPNISECLDTLAGSKWFCTLDLTSGYWQVPLRKEDRPKTAFSVGGGLYQFTVMPFGLCNAPSTFERMMDMVLVGLVWEECMVYLDDVIVFGEDFDKTLGHLAHVFDRIRSAGLTVYVQH